MDIKVKEKRVVSERGKLNQKEAYKSIRDALIISAAASIPPLVEQILIILNNTDFGQWTAIVSIVLGVASPFINRYLNIIRVK